MPAEGASTEHGSLWCALSYCCVSVASAFYAPLCQSPSRVRCSVERALTDRLWLQGAPHCRTSAEISSLLLAMSLQGSDMQMLLLGI